METALVWTRTLQPNLVGHLLQSCCHLQGRSLGICGSIKAKDLQKIKKNLFNQWHWSWIVVEGCWVVFI